MYQERVFMDKGIQVEVFFASSSEFFLRLKNNTTTLVEYSPGLRTIRGKATPYEFKSVEKLRYDFEQDAEHSR
jgi:hypothetical protein